MDYDHPDETFFESEEARPSCMDARTAAKMVARHRQQLIADDLSRTTAGEYLEDILKHTQTMEASLFCCVDDVDETLPDASLIDMQREVQWYMRPYLIDFLIEAHAAFVLLPETLFLTVNLLDRYCSRRVVYRHHYQLVGCAALLIAAKYGDKKDRVPQISELSNMCCALYDGGMFSQMEMHLLDTLEWSIGHPTVDFYIHLMVTYEGHGAVVDCLASYLSEMALYHRDFVSVRPSVLARVCLTVASFVLGRSEGMEFGPDEEKTVAESLFRHLDSPSPTLARKYSSTGTYRVSQRLAEFLAARAAEAASSMAQRHVDPPTPPPMEKRGGDIYSTPHKGQVVATVAAMDGYLTPPITPDGGCFVAPRCPMTPTPEFQQHVGLLPQR
ncbi:hypothetical protein L249_1319 [Ophiocordyceps polyrhachis-furcata BCC 54312]|uniref:Cyclin-like domain-containing protein n=1 Tax=Ophiocordyceps polyrhachis-furcata BCC 54312 TaxID=1330021 RepID=A0A367LD12_9HYPO|nr:hypothetical protein L249_1319 [Ophiocordyceps polyrhachis-furcata BCC 54312]